MVRICITRRTSIVAVALLARHAQAFVSPAFLAQTTTKSNRSFSRTSFLTMSTSGEAAKKRVLVPIGNGSEEIETTCITDTLTRFGAEVVVASVMPDGDLVCKMSRNIKFLADVTMKDAATEEWDLIALPGGMPGAEHLRDCKDLVALLEKQKSQGKLYAAVCAAPAVALASNGLIEGSATCFPVPAFRAALPEASDDAVVVTKNLVTSQGPGTALKFALQLGEEMFGKEKADEIAAQMLVER